MKLARPVVALIISALLCSLALTAQCAGIVTIDVTAQSVKSDDASLELKWVKPKGEQIGAFVQNNTLEPRDVLVKVTGLIGRNYDIYINTKYAGAKTAKQLESGLPLTIDGSAAHPDMMLCLNTIQPFVEAEYLRLRLVRDPAPARVSETLVQAVDWVRSGIKIEKIHRSIAIIVVPKGQMLEKTAAPTWLDARDTAAAVTRACWYLQKARAKMAAVIEDPDLRNTAVAAMTPVDFTTSFVVRNGKPHVEAVITNSCNLPISGKLTAALPKGWKWAAKNAAFSDLKTGKAFKLSFDLARTVPGSPVPAGVKVVATVTLDQEPFKATYQIKTVARTPTPESAIAKPKPAAGKPALVAPPDMVKPLDVKP